MLNKLKQNWRWYCCEALGLGIFMASACFFSAMLNGGTSWERAFPDPVFRLVLTGILMGATALLIFYSPFTSPSGSHINPAVTLTLWRLGRIDRWDTVFYIVFQVFGGTVAVYLMALVVGRPLTSLPVNYAVTVPAKSSEVTILTEFVIAFLMMTMVLLTSSNEKWKRYTKLISGCLVCLYAVFAGPVSGFGMNPARSLASAIPANTWTAFWIYLFVPVVGMLSAAELFLWIERRRLERRNRQLLHAYLRQRMRGTINDEL